MLEVEKEKDCDNSVISKVFGEWHESVDVAPSISRLIEKVNDIKFEQR